MPGKELITCVWECLVFSSLDAAQSNPRPHATARISCHGLFFFPGRSVLRRTRTSTPAGLRARGSDLQARRQGAARGGLGLLPARGYRSIGSHRGLACCILFFSLCLCCMVSPARWIMSCLSQTSRGGDVSSPSIRGTIVFEYEAHACRGLCGRAGGRCSADTMPSSRSALPRHLGEASCVLIQNANLVFPRAGRDPLPRDI